MSNSFTKFFDTIGQEIEDVSKWAPAVAKDSTEVITALKTDTSLSPEIQTGLISFIEAAATLAANAGIAVSQKGLNPMQDLTVFHNLVAFVESFTVFHTLISDGIKVIEGKKLAPIVEAATETAQTVETVVEAVDPPVFTPPPPPATGTDPEVTKG